MSRYEHTRLKLAEMVSLQIAREQKIARLKAFVKFMTSETGAMLFAPETDMWMNGPDYIADEYKRERYFKRHKKPLLS